MTASEQVARFLESYGPWGLCVILLGAIYWLFKYFMGLLEKRNEQLKELSTEATVALKQSKESNDKLMQQLDRLERRLDDER